jgi:hypothetical protein
MPKEVRSTKSNCRNSIDVAAARQSAAFFARGSLGVVVAGGRSHEMAEIVHLL